MSGELAEPLDEPFDPTHVDELGDGYFEAAPDPDRPLAPVEDLAAHRKLTLGATVIRSVLESGGDSQPITRTTALLDYVARLLEQDDTLGFPDELVPHMPVSINQWVIDNFKAVQRIEMERNGNQNSAFAYLQEDTVMYDHLPWLTYLKTCQDLMPLNSEPRWAETAMRLMLYEARNQL